MRQCGRIGQRSLLTACRRHLAVRAIIAPSSHSHPSDSRHSLSNKLNVSDDGWWMTLQRNGSADARFSFQLPSDCAGSSCTPVDPLYQPAQPTLVPHLTTVRQRSAMRRTADIT